MTGSATSLAVKNIANSIVHEMFRVQSAETVVITCEPHSNLDVVEAIAEAVHAADAYAVIMRTPPLKGRLSLVDQSVPTDLFVNALNSADIWIDANSNDFLYSNTFNRVMAQNEKLRYILLGDMATDVMAKIYSGYEIAKMIAFCNQLKEIIAAGKTVTMTNPQGTHITFELEPSHIIAVDSGEATKPGLYTPPALVNIVPRFGSVNGTLFFDALYDAYPDKMMDEPLKLVIVDSVIVSAENNPYAEKFMQTANSWDENGRKVAHVNFGLLPTFTELTGHVVIDERVWGVLNWGFGSVNPLDAPPHGQASDYHFDAICTNGSVWIDDVQISENGAIVHGELKKLSDKFM